MPANPLALAHEAIDRLAEGPKVAPIATLIEEAHAALDAAARDAYKRGAADVAYIDEGLGVTDETKGTPDAD